MTITIITPTADQPRGIELLETYMKRQTIQPDQWIVADDGDVPATLTMGQTHLVAKREHEGAKSLASNMLRALEAVEGGAVIICEHDDWYAADHIEMCLRQLSGYDATGSVWQRYYNVEHRVARVMRNIGSTLCNTAFQSALVPSMRKAAQTALERNSIGVDALFWQSVPSGNVHEVNTVVGIKGLPGRKGLGMGHKPPDKHWTRDPEMVILQEWIGSDWRNYV